MVKRDKKPPVNKPQIKYIEDFSSGLNSTISGSLLNDNEAQVADNLSFEQKGTLLPRRGRTKRYSAVIASTPVTGLGAYYKTDGTSFLVVTSGTSVYKDSLNFSEMWTHKTDWEKGVSGVNIDLATSEGDVQLKSSITTDLSEETSNQSWDTDGTLTNTEVVATGEMRPRHANDLDTTPDGYFPSTYQYAIWGAPTEWVKLTRFNIRPRYSGSLWKLRVWRKSDQALLASVDHTTTVSGTSLESVVLPTPLLLDPNEDYCFGVYCSANHNPYWSSAVSGDAPFTFKGQFATHPYDLAVYSTSAETFPSTGSDILLITMGLEPIFEQTGLTLTKSDEVNYDASGDWTRDVIDLGTYELKNPTGGTVTWQASLPTGTELEIQYCTSDDNVTWGSWATVASSGDAITPKKYVQVKALLTANTTDNTSPSVDSITLNITGCTAYGEWASQAVDVSNAKDKTISSVTDTQTLSSGTITLYSASSPDNSAWTDWVQADVDGTLNHTPDNWIKLKYYFEGDAVLHDAVLLLDGNASATALETTLTDGANYDFTMLRNILILVNGHNAPRKWDGVTSTTELLGGSPPVLKFVTTHHNRLWGVDADNPSRVRFSNILDPETWDAFDFIDFNPEDGDYITAIMRYGQNLVVSKKRSMALLTGNKTSNYAVSWLDSEQGCTGERAMCQADKYVAYVSQDGIRFTDLSNSVIATERLLPHWDEINLRRLSGAAVVYWRHSLFVALPSKNSLVNDEVWAYDFLRNSWSIYRDWGISAFLKFHQYGEDVLLGSNSSTGQVYQLLTSNSYDDDQAIAFTWRSKDFHFGHPERYKLFRKIFLNISGVVEETTLDLDLLVDGVKTGTYTTTIPAGDGVKHVRLVLPPLYGAVLGRMLTLEVRGRCGVQSVSIQYVVRGTVPSEGDL